MKKSQIISLSKKISNRFTKSYPTAIFNNLNSDPFLKQIPFSFHEKIMVSFLTSLHKEGFDPELFYDEIENNLFVVVFEFINTKGIEVDCPNCDSTGQIYCTNCNGNGDFECPECDGTGDHWDYNVSEPCEMCSGDGEIECDTCEGTGYESCNYCVGDGYIENEDGVEYTEWHVYSWDKDFFDKFELMGYNEVVPSELYDDFWDNDKTLWIEEISIIFDEDSDFNEGDAVLINFEKI